MCFGPLRDVVLRLRDRDASGSLALQSLHAALPVVAAGGLVSELVC